MGTVPTICRVEEGHTHVRDVTETGNIVKTADGAEAVKAAFAKMAGEGTYPEELYSDL